MDAEYGQRYRDLYARHWWWRAREAALLDTLKAIAPVGSRHWILDVGCGDGLFFDRLHEMGEVEGIEPDASLVDPQGAHRHRIHIQPFDDRFRPSANYSLILMLDVLEHLEDPVAALRHAASLLTETGRLVITVPAFRILWTNHDVINHHPRRATPNRRSGPLARGAASHRPRRVLVSVDLSREDRDRIGRTRCFGSRPRRRLFLRRGSTGGFSRCTPCRARGTARPRTSQTALPGSSLLVVCRASPMAPLGDR